MSKQVHAHVVATKRERTRVVWARHNLSRFYIWFVQKKARDFLANHKASNGKPKHLRKYF